MHSYVSTLETRIHINGSKQLLDGVTEYAYFIDGNIQNKEGTTKLKISGL